MEGKECIWSGIDYALEPAVRRVLKAVFSSIQAAQEIHTFFEDVSKASRKYFYHIYMKNAWYIISQGVDSAKQVGVAEYQEEDLGSWANE